MLIRSTCSAIVAAGLTLAVVPLGCGGAQQEEYRSAAFPQQDSLSPADAWVMPEAVVEQLRGCVKKHASELRTYSHETRFDLTVTNDGAVNGIKIRSSTLHHEAIESCLTGALEGLSIPPSMFPVRSSSQPFSGGESMRHSRAPLGVVQAAGAVVVLAPIVIVAAGVTLGVYILAVAAEETIEAVKRNRKLDTMCQGYLDHCVANRRQPPWNREMFGDWKQCEACFGYCLDKKYWPTDKCPLSN